MTSQNLDNCNESQRNSIISLKDETIDRTNGLQQTKAVTEKPNIISLQSEATESLQDSKIKNSICTIEKEATRRSSSTIEKVSNRNKNDALEELNDDKICNSNETSDAEKYVKIPVRDLISTFEKQTRPIIRYKLRDEHIFIKQNENAAQKEMNESNKENEKPQNNEVTAISLENSSSKIDNQKVEKYEENGFTSDSYSNFDQNESQFVSISYNSMNSKTETQVITPTPYRFNDEVAAITESEIKKSYEYENNEDKGKIHLICWFI